MRILIVHTSVIPALLYGGTERVIWGLGKELARLGHEVSYLVLKGSKSPFAEVLALDENRSLADQITEDYDFVHYNGISNELPDLGIPYLLTMHGNAGPELELDRNTVFVSADHAKRYGSETYVHNGLDWSDYTAPDLEMERTYFHFLGNAAWRVKNVQGAIDTVKRCRGERLKVLGGRRFNFKMGMRFTFSRQVSFEGFVGGERKFSLLNGSKGLIFPVRWHEPFGLSIIESMFYGCPVFGTPYGALKELVLSDVGFLADNQQKLAEAIQDAGSYSRRRCHDYAQELFNNRAMTAKYIALYEKVIRGDRLNQSAPRLQGLENRKLLEWY